MDGAAVFLPFGKRPGHDHRTEPDAVFRVFLMTNRYFSAGFIDKKDGVTPENAHHVAQIIRELGRGGKQRYGLAHQYSSRS